MSKKKAAEKGDARTAPTMTVDEAVAHLEVALAEARQRVKPVVVREREGEQVTTDLLNLRLRSRARR